LKQHHCLAALGSAALLSLTVIARAQQSPPAPKLKDEMRQPWTRNDTGFIKNWQLAGPFSCKLEAECAAIPGGEANAGPGVTGIQWEPTSSWSDVVGLFGDSGGALTYATTNLTRARAGKARLSLGSSNGIRVWVNGKPVLAHDGQRSLTPDEEQVDIDLKQGANTLLLKTFANASFAVRVLESGAMLAPYAEIGPSIVRESASGFTVKTDIDDARPAAEPVTVEVIQPGGKVLFSATAPRGAEVAVDAGNWPSGPVEVRATTRTARGFLYVTHLPWYKGDALAKARELAAEAAKADDSKPEGFTLKMLANMVDDRLGVKLAAPQERNLGNPWRQIHAALMEFDELMLERRGQTGRVRPYGFVRLGWRDEVDDTPQYCRVNLPADYDQSKKWPTVLQLHGYNPPNPVYWDWWSADNRGYIHTDYAGHGDIIYIEPHGRGNTFYTGLGDSDVLRCLDEAKRLLSIDADRVYLTGDSMGGWGTWNVASRHPDVFAAIAPVFGGVDYHSELTEEQLAALDPVERFWQDKRSSWSMADSLINLPVYVHHGDRDTAVNVEWSRYGVRMLQRWGYNVRYHEYPGKVHEALGPGGNGELSVPWFLEHRRNQNPPKVRIRSAELRNASAYWIRVQQAASPLDFMVVDAEVVDRNVIRLDTQNVLDIVLSPKADLVDTTKPVKVVWNGVPRKLTASRGELRLTDPGHQPSKLRKTPALPGGGRDFYVTPFAVVFGTTAKDPEMKELIRKRAQFFIDSWIKWQKFSPRVFTDTGMTEADIGRYSLLLFGGPRENAVAAKLASQLPLRIDAGAIRIDGGEYKVTDAALQMLYPNPRNPQRYVWLVAATSTRGMYHADPNVYNGNEWDYFIADGHVPARGVAASQQRLSVVSGMFDYQWRYADSLAIRGDAQVRDQGRVVRGPNRKLVIEPAVLAKYSGRFQFQDGPDAEFRVSDGKLFLKVNDDETELLPETESIFYSEQNNFTLEFRQDASGSFNELWGWNGSEFTGKRMP
jgi:dienelactone hydrolase